MFVLIMLQPMKDYPKLIREVVHDLDVHDVRVTRVRFDSDDLPFRGYKYDVDVFLLFDINDFTISVVYNQQELLDALLDSKSFHYIRSSLSLTEEEFNVFKSHFNKEH